MNLHIMLPVHRQLPLAKLGVEIEGRDGRDEEDDHHLLHRLRSPSPCHRHMESWSEVTAKHANTNKIQINVIF